MESEWEELAGEGVCLDVCLSPSLLLLQPCVWASTYIALDISQHFIYSYINMCHIPWNKYAIHDYNDYCIWWQNTFGMNFLFKSPPLLSVASCKQILENMKTFL